MIQTSESLELANENAYESLISLIENNQNQLSLIIVSCDDLTLRQQIIDRYEQEARLDNIQSQRIVLGTEPSLKAGLVKLALPDESRVVVTVTGSEWLLRVKTRASDAQSDLQKFFGYLQWTREGLRKFQYPVVLWITSTILLEMSRKAPDFWSWRKAVLRFTSESADPVSPVAREYSSTPANEVFASARVDRDDDDFILPPAEILSEISKLAARDPASANLATLYAKLAEIYTKRIARGETTNLEQEQQQAIEAYHQAIDRYRVFNKKSALASILNEFGIFLFTQSRYQDAINFYQKSLEIQREVVNYYGEAAALLNLGNAYDSLGEYQQSINFYEQSLKIQSKLGNRGGEANSLNNLGIAHNALGEYQRAINFYQQSLEIHRKIGDLHGEAISLNGLGNTYNALGEYQRAINFYQQSLEIHRKIGDPNGEASSLGNLGNIYSSIKQYQRAIDFYQQSLEIHRKTGNRRCEADCLYNQALALINYNSQKSEALDILKQALVIYIELEIELGIKECNELIISLDRITAT